MKMKKYYMKKFLLMWAIFLCAPTIFAKDKVKVVCYQDLCYTINVQNHTAALSSYKRNKSEIGVNVTDNWRSWCYQLKSKIVDIVIPSEIYVNKEKYVVTEISSYAFLHCNIEKVVIPNTVTVIGKGAFDKCFLLRSITIPNSVVEIGYHAFFDCPKLVSLAIPNSVKRMGGLLVANGKLEEIIVPDEEVELIGKEERENEYWVRNGEYLFFKGSYYVQKVKGNTLPFCPSYMVKHIEKEAPFFKKGYYEDQQKLFSFYAYEKAKSIISDWEKKKEYETSAQWQNRVTEQNRNMQVEKVLNRLRMEYIDKNTPAVFKAEIGSYDADYQTFPVKVDGMNTIYVKVPYSDAESFKNNWNSVNVKPQYGVINDHMAVIDAKFYCGDKEYALSETYESEYNNSLALNLSPLQLDLSDGNNQSAMNTPTIQIDNFVDNNIPLAASSNSTTFAVIIGNEKYTRVDKVPFAQNDAKIFAEYCKKTLGLPAKNVKVYENATYGTMIGAVSDIQKIAKAFKGDISIIFYYAGHGIPDEATGDGYLLPIDADGLNMRVCYPLSQLYNDLGSMQARSVTCFMDACFSGAQRGSGMVVAARGVAIKAKNDHPTGNTVVFTAATDKQTAYPYEEKGHGMFTYYLLKKLCDTKGDCTLGELGSYICDEVAKQAVVTNGKEQTPVVLTSAGVTDSWRMMKLK